MSTAVVFPGQGAQYVGMGKGNAERFASAREVFERADAALGFSLSRLCWEGPQAELDRTDVSQPAIYTASAAAMAAWRELAGSDGAADTSTIQKAGDPPDAVVAAGLSLGEYSALHYAGALTFEDGLKLVRARGEAMQAACDAEPSGMTSVIGLERAQLEEIVQQAAGEGVICLANINSPQQIALSGALPALEKAGELARAAGAKRVVPLTVAGAFHSPLMAPARDQLAAAVEAVAMSAPMMPVLANATAEESIDPAVIKARLLDQLTGSVEWVGCVQRMVALGAERFCEVGPGKVLTGLLRRIDRGVKGVSVDEVGA